MDDLELLKKDWQQEKANEFHQYTENELFAMTKQKSVSVAKWVFIIGFLEILFWFGLDFAFSSYEEEIQFHNQFVEKIVNILNVISKIIPIAFLGYILYLNKKIKNIECSQRLMKKILLIKNSVQLYIKIIIAQFIIIFMIGMVVGILEAMRENDIQTDSPDSAFIVLILFIMIVILIFIVLFLRLFYHLIYGKLIKQLEENYKELSKIEE